ncbi:hypothetical protein [Sulfurimonas sp. HSL3-7]|uniref:hypothetical protein n=1 Tax=Sulfonitrofixus jiaomeiensis TaxID=3131938 RepID=UPI0031F8650E
MKKVLFLLFLISTLLNAQSDTAKSTFLIESESMDIEHKSTYGVTDSYSFLIAAHQFQPDDDLLFYIGTKLGFIAEEYTAENGFGPDTESFGTAIEANIGLNYALKDFQHITLEGNHLQDALHQQKENKVTIAYQYDF